MTNKWREFPSSKYTLMDLGRPAVFLVPTKKLQCRMNDVSIEEAIRQFLMKEFSAFSMTPLPYFGVWMDGEMIHYDECCRYEVSFLGKQHIQTLLEFLSDVAIATEEICLYVCAGQYTCLLYPKTAS